MQDQSEPFFLVEPSTLLTPPNLLCYVRFMKTGWGGVMDELLVLIVITYFLTITGIRHSLLAAPDWLIVPASTASAIPMDKVNNYK